MPEQQLFQQCRQQLLLQRLCESRGLVPIFPSLVWVFSILCLVSRPFAIAINNNEVTIFRNIQETK